MDSKSRKCLNSPDEFCYICGEFTAKTQRRSLTNTVKDAYLQYFGFAVRNENKTWVPKFCCTSCYGTLIQWMRGASRSMRFGVPMIWREPRDHTTDCYFCLTDKKGIKASGRKKIVYPYTTSASRPVAHNEDLPVPVTPSGSSQTSEAPVDEEGELPGNIETSSQSSDPDFLAPGHEKHSITQEELNDLVRDLKLTKSNAELLASRLMEWNLCAENTKITYFRKRNEKLSRHFMMKGNLCVCKNIEGLMKDLNFVYTAEEWRLFIDSSKTSLKAVLLHIGNKLPSIPVAHSVGMKETYESLTEILKEIGYEKHRWKVCADLKVIALIMGMQTGYTKYCCFLCLWDSRASENHYAVKNWPPRQRFLPGKENVRAEPLVDSKDVLLPPLHIKLGLMKNFVKALDKTGAAFEYLRRKFPKLSDAKLKEGIFIGPQIRKLLHDTNFDSTLTPVEHAAWTSFKSVVRGFLGNNRDENYREIIQQLIESYRNLGCHMSLKLHFLHSHLDFFPDNLGAVSDEHGERFHQDIQDIEHRYQGKWDSNMMGDYCWFLIREDAATHKRKKYRKISE